MGSRDVERILLIIAGELMTTVDDLSSDGTTFSDLGMDASQARTTLARISRELGTKLPPNFFNTCHTAVDIREYFAKKSLAGKAETQTQTQAKPAPPAEETPTAPLSILLQGQIATAETTIFLLPDGSGAGMAYAKFPKIDPSVCLMALNSPFLYKGADQSFTVEGIAAKWTDEIVRRQPKGEYVIGGWSAGGYYAFEVVKALQSRGKAVKTLILIDSPCRRVYEQLPMPVVHYLAENNLMGNFGSKAPPQWMVEHFDITIKAVADYNPTPMTSKTLPNVCLIWAKDGVLKDAADEPTAIDMKPKITGLLLRRDQGFGPLGWDELFPGAELSIAKADGNHFTMVFPPNCASLSILLRDCVKGRSKERWTRSRG